MPHDRWVDKEDVVHTYSGISLSLVAVVQSLGHVWLFATPWTSARQAFLSFTISLSLLKFMSIESVMLSNHFILCHPLFFLPSVFPIRVFSRELAPGGQSIGASAFASVLPMDIQGWFPLGLTTINMAVQASIWDPAFHSFQHLEVELLNPW